MSKMLCTFCVIMIQPEQQPVSLADGWAWLANIVNISTPVPSAAAGDEGRFPKNGWLWEECVLCVAPLSRLVYLLLGRYNCAGGVSRYELCPLVFVLPIKRYSAL
jgi:hypothetical protein